MPGAPAAALPAGEPNRHLAKFKTSLVKRWSHTRMNDLYDELHLAAFLWVLEREKESLEILGSVTSAVTAPPTPRGVPNYNVWCPVATMNALEARILRVSGDPTLPTARIVADPGLAPNPAYIAGQVNDADTAFTAATAETSMKWACHRLASTVTGLVLLGELAAADHPYAAWYDAEEVDRLVLKGHDLLAARLTTAA